MADVLPSDAPDPVSAPQEQAPAPAPQPQTKISLSTAMAQLRDEISNTLTQLGANAEASGTELQKFLNVIQPDIGQALDDGDLLSLNYLRDRSAMELGRVSLGLINKERIAILNTITTVMRMLIKIGIGAIPGGGIATAVIGAVG